SAAMDISDGLALDLSRLCRAAQVTAEISVAAIPLSEAGQTLAAASPGALETILTGGDDYEILATVPPERARAFEEASSNTRVPAPRIGIIKAGPAPPQFVRADGSELTLAASGFEHFRV